MLSAGRILYTATQYSSISRCTKMLKRYRLCLTKSARVIRISSFHTRHAVQQLQKNWLNKDLSLDPKIEAIKHLLLYSDYVENKKLKLGYIKNKMVMNERQKIEKRNYEEEQLLTPADCIALKYLGNSNKSSIVEEKLVQETEVEKSTHMPYASTDHFETVPIDSTQITDTLESDENELSLNKEYKALYEKYLEKTKWFTVEQNAQNGLYSSFSKFVDKNRTSVRLTDDLSKVPPNWMTDYEEYDDTLQDDSWKSNYGTPRANVPVSNVPCGGCGALLHCKDAEVPGYLPSELFLNQSEQNLKNMTCRRCHFMKYYNTSLDVKVSPEEYPELLKQIKGKKVAVILMVDLMDFPCSIWPNIMTIIGNHLPIFVVGNKVDLLPQDSPDFFKHVQNCLLKALQEAGISEANIKHVALTSSKTGYGIEELINKLHKIWRYKGDVYLIGCTNVGKSSMFNVLIQSDYCKVQAVDLVQRATISPWPGTTLNLLKFPILRPSSKKLYVRTQRLIAERKEVHEFNKFKKYQYRLTKNLAHATLEGPVGRTFQKKLKGNEVGMISMGSNIVDKGTFGLNESLDIYKQSKWCYDTPGVIQPDQVLHLLTTEELMLTLPNQIISPRTFMLIPEQTLFLAGLGRLDYVKGSDSIRCTVFCSKRLPITICHSIDADNIYKELLQTEAFVVPINDPKRLKLWPKLESMDLETTGISENESAADVILSSAGWVAITPKQDELVSLRAWTPEKRGIYLRTPALLRKSVTLRGSKLYQSPAYKRGRQIYSK